MSVNDLVTGELRPAGNCASALRTVANKVWHPVSKPPTETDGDGYGFVLVYYPGDGAVSSGVDIEKIWFWDLNHPDSNDRCKWARLRDVILLPPGETC